MNNLNYIDKTNMVTAVKNTFFGSFVVNIINSSSGFKLLVSVPPEKGTLCCPVSYCLDGWENITSVANAIQVAHCFIARKRTERIEQYKARLSLYKPHRA